MAPRSGKTSKAASKAPSIIDETLSLTSLRQSASWIRDELEPRVARDGPDALKAHDVVSLHSLLLNLQDAPTSIHILKHSRIYLAVQTICSKATRWSGKLIDEADQLVEMWEEEFGPLRTIRTPLYQMGGRLYTICEPCDTTRQDLLRRFQEEDPQLVDDKRAYLHGHLNFKPGKWWINGTFAFRDGIINNSCIDGGIVYTKMGAYAIVLKGDEEMNAPDPSRFTYRCPVGDRGRFRLTTGNFKSRFPVRILRDHRLASIWAPKTGIRYDGLYKVIGWTVRPCKPEKNDGHTVRFDIHFEAVELSLDFDKILRIPRADQNDDYKMYKIIHREQREDTRRGARNIFESSWASELLDESPGAGTTGRHMSIDEVALLGALKDAAIEWTSTSETENDNNGKTSMDGALDRNDARNTSSSKRRLAYVRDLYPPSSDNWFSRKRSNMHAPRGLSAWEPFASLRQGKGSSRRSYDGSDESAPLTIYKRFRPINWQPLTFQRLKPALDVTDEQLNAIAPFSDLRRKRESSIETTALSPKTSVTDLRARHRSSMRRDQSSLSETIYEHRMDGKTSPRGDRQARSGSWM